MRSDTILLTNKDNSFEEALKQAEKVAAYKAMNAKNALHLRLLTEEMMGMMRALTGERKAEFYIDDQDGVYALHLIADAHMNSSLRSSLLEVSKTGKNSAAKGFSGKLRDLFERFMEPQIEGGGDVVPLTDHMFASAEFGVLPMPVYGQWSLKTYRQAADEGRTPKETWDELERSVVAKLADDVQIGIQGSRVEMTILKKF